MSGDLVTHYSRQAGSHTNGACSELGGGARKNAQCTRRGSRILSYCKFTAISLSNGSFTGPFVQVNAIRRNKMMKYEVIGYFARLLRHISITKLTLNTLYQPKNKEFPHQPPISCFHRVEPKLAKSLSLSSHADTPREGQSWFIQDDIENLCPCNNPSQDVCPFAFII